MKFLLIGNGAREHAIGEAVTRSSTKPELVVFADRLNPALKKLAAVYEQTDSLTDFEKLKELVQREKPELAIVGPEAPIAAGAADLLEELGVSTIAPLKSAAQLESSKSFARNLIHKYEIGGNPEFSVFQQNKDLSDAEVAGLIHKFMEYLGGEFAVKADGLRGGKGVKVTGDHLTGLDDGLYFAKKCLAEDGRVIIEEKLVGEEFSAMFLTDGKTLAALPIVQDSKRAFEGDLGPNTGGMGSYSDADNSLPFLRPEDLAEARRITTETLTALQTETKTTFRGVIYGGFIATARGVRLIEFNVRFGDPEVLNALPILRTDFVKICRAIVQQRLAEIPLEFEKKATVCKYAVPEGYPTNPQTGKEIKLFGVPQGCRVYYAAADADSAGRLFTGSSRALAFVGIADTLTQAEQLAEKGVRSAEGPLFHRRDIGTETLINRRILNLQNLRRQPKD